MSSLIYRNIRPLFPVVGPGVRERNCPLKASLARQKARVSAQMPLAGHVSVISRILQQGRNRDHVATQHALIMRRLLLLGREHFRNIGHTGQVSVHTR